MLVQRMQQHTHTHTHAPKTTTSRNRSMNSSSRANRQRAANSNEKRPKSGKRMGRTTDENGKSRPERTRTRRTSMIAAAVALTLALLATTTLTTTTTQAAVVRPTVFSDLNAPDTAQQQQQQQQANGGLPNPAAPLADGPHQPTSTKINPYKSRFCTALNGARTDAPLGLQSLAIDDLALSASSYSNEQVGPHLARLNLDISGGAWCPVKPISGSNFGKEWIQAKLNRSFVVSAIETQGRFGMGNGKEFVPSYQVEYSRNGGQTWHKWKDFRGSSLLRANEDVNTAVKNELSPPIVGANVIRILPYSQHLRTVCLRFELHGCPYDEGAPVAYATSDGVVEPRWGHLIDYTYDGLRQRGQLSAGLGQLVDGVKGPDNFSHNSGFEWVGWKSMNGDVVIEFTFKTLRNFTGALFHSNNLFSSGVEVFQGVDVHYGIDVPLSLEALKDSLGERWRRGALLGSGRQQSTGAEAVGEQQFAAAAAAAALDPSLSQATANTLWSTDVLSIEYEPDKKLETSRPVTVHLKQRLANKLRFVLKFASKWILVSEVEFLSHPVELLSLASISDQHTPPLMVALAPAKTYDEYVAILREHQLRRIATNAYLESFGSNSSTTMANNLLSETAGDQPPAPSAELSSLPPVERNTNNQYPYENYLVSSSAPRDPMAGKRVTGPAIPNGAQMVWQGTGATATSSGGDPGAPSTNPILSGPFSGQAGIYPASMPNEFLGGQQQQQGDFINNNNSNNQKASSSAQSESGRRTMGVATVISFGLVLILVLLGASFAVSSYRLRHHQSKQAAAAAGMGHPASKGLGVSPGLQNFMSVFGASHQQQQQQPGDHYSAIFGTGQRTQPHHLAHSQEQRAAASTLKRLATLTGSQKSAHPLLLQQQQQQHQLPNQLLVSVKDSGRRLFGGGQAATKSQAVGSQLIVGLNQANPLAQQQIYNSSNLNCSNQTYATHYSTSMSMASSSTTGHQGDYADYAIPDAQPIIPPPLPLAPQQTLQHHHHHQQQQHHHHLHPHNHLNQAFNSLTHHQHQQHTQQASQFKTPLFGAGYQTELRPGHHLQQAIKQQQQQQQQQQGSQQQQQSSHQPLSAAATTAANNAPLYEEYLYFDKDQDTNNSNTNTTSNG